jgi:hypothetical protein
VSCIESGFSLAILKRNTFVTGFLTAALLWLAWWMFVSFRFQGGHIEDSPSAKYSLMASAPMSETVGGTYTVTLKDKTTGKTLRSATVKLNANEKTRSLRGLPISMSWDAQESYSDITIDGVFLIRLSVPSPTP